MLNYRVASLDRMLAQLGAGGVEVLDRVEELPGIGRFGWAVDPEGSRTRDRGPQASDRNRPLGGMGDGALIDSSPPQAAQLRVQRMHRAEVAQG